MNIMGYDIRPNWFTHNLLCGLKIALFIPTEQRINASWHALVAIAVTLFASQLVIEFIVDGVGGYLSWGWYHYPLCLFSITLAASYLICALTHKESYIIEIAAAYYYSFLYIFVPFVMVFITEPLWYDGDSYKLIKMLCTIWAFLIMFRITSEYLFEHNLLKLILAGLIGSGAMFIVNDQFYFDRIYYVEEAQEDAEQTPFESLTDEDLFAMQDGQRKENLEYVTASKPGQTDIYALTFGSYAYQDIFMRETLYINGQLKERLRIDNILTMINNEETVIGTPIATATNLRAYLNDLASNYMQPDEDIALLYLTSHGGQTQGLSVELNYRYSLNNLSPESLAEILKESGIKNKVIIISACYSGAFIPHLQDENTMIITAAASDRTSFGCSDENDLTYFTQAYFEALSETTNLEGAFHLAKEKIQIREAEEGLSPPSNPQIFIGKNIKSALKSYGGAPLTAQDQ